MIWVVGSLVELVKCWVSWSFRWWADGVVGYEGSEFVEPRVDGLVRSVCGKRMVS